MHPVAKRIIIHGGLTAGVLTLIGLMFAEMAGIWTAGNIGKPNSDDLNPPITDSLRYRVPLTLAGAGFLFVAVGELIGSRLRQKKLAAQPAPPQPDDAEKLLNELLAQAEAKMAAEAEPQNHRATEPQRTEEKKTE